jgi:hypothetical protein
LFSRHAEHHFTNRLRDGAWAVLEIFLRMR